jgi:hypothetical protein
LIKICDCSFFAQEVLLHTSKVKSAKFDREKITDCEEKRVTIDQDGIVSSAVREDITKGGGTLSNQTSYFFLKLTDNLNTDQRSHLAIAWIKMLIGRSKRAAKKFQL